jgi:hypothetical protein
MSEIWPEVFEHPEIIATREPAALCADGLEAWALCMSGCKQPDSFGHVLVKIDQRLGMEKAATWENLTEHAKSKGWLKAEGGK